MLSQLVWIRTYPDDETARGAQRLLDVNGVHSIIADDYGGAGPELMYACGTRLAVREDDVRTARVLLESDQGG